MKITMNRIVMIMVIMIIHGMTMVPITLTVIVVPAIVARNERLAVDLTILIKSINGVARVHGGEKAHQKAHQKV